jgi:hypothetical protein
MLLRALPPLHPSDVFWHSPAQPFLFLPSHDAPAAVLPTLSGIYPPPPPLHAVLLLLADVFLPLEPLEPLPPV